MSVSVETVRCPCRGNLDCKLCSGQKFYNYELGPRGWIPFTCPTCSGTGVMSVAEGEEPRPCVTCHGEKWVDPGFPPSAEGTRGWLRKVWRIFMGG